MIPNIAPTHTYEQRLSTVESAIVGINANLSDVKELLKTSIKTDERVSVLERENVDQEVRLRKVEQIQTAGRWTERVIWLLVALGLGFLFKREGI